MAKNILKSTLIIMLITIVSRGMGFIRTIFISNQFGTSLEASAYMLSFAIPNVFFLFLPGALNATFVPVLKEVLATGDFGGAKKLFNRLFTFSLVISLILILFLYFTADYVVRLIAGNASIELINLSITLLRLMLPSLLFILLISIFSSLLNVYYYFILPVIGPIINSLIVIISLYYFVPIWGINGLAIGTSLGYLGAALVMLPVLSKEKYNLSLDFNWHDPYLQKLGILFLPVMLGSVITFLNEFLEKYLVAGFGDDKIAALGYARQIYQLPIAIFFGSLAVPLFIIILDQVKANNLREAKKTIEQGMLSMLLIFLPTTIGFWLIGKEIVVILLQRGSFDANSTVVTTSALIFFAVGIYPYIAKDIITRTFYAFNDTITPVVIGFGQIGIYVLSTLFFRRYIGFAGAALGWSLGMWLGFLMLAIILWRRIGRFITRKFFVSLLKIVVATIIMGISILLLENMLYNWNVYWYTIVILFVAIIIYSIILVITKEEEALKLLQRIKRKRVK